MSKSDDLRKTYPSIIKVTFDKFNEGDKTPTKKYLEYLLKMWEQRVKFESNIRSSSHLIETVSKFDVLLPYIEIKDIYNKFYSSFGNLERTIHLAEELKEEKTFNRDENIYVLRETDTYIMISPKTHKGSLKYGANTKWCTASKFNKNTFDSYIRNGVLCYVISKNESVSKNYEKIAIYIDTNVNCLLDKINIYNSYDNIVSEKELNKAGWKSGDIFDLTTMFRVFAKEINNIKSARITLELALGKLQSINVDDLSEAMEYLFKSSNNEYIKEFIETSIYLTEKIKKMLSEHKR